MKCQQEEPDERRRAGWRSLVAPAIVFAATTFVLMPFARLYALVAAAVAAYNYGSLAWEIRDGKTDRSALAWGAVMRTAIVALAFAVSIALAHKR